jgi:hypothetical protein
LFFCYDPGSGLSRDVERCTSANVYAVTKRLKMNKTRVSTKVKGKGGDKGTVRPKREMDK